MVLGRLAEFVGFCLLKRNGKIPLHKPGRIPARSSHDILRRAEIYFVVSGRLSLFFFFPEEAFEFSVQEPRGY